MPWPHFASRYEQRLKAIFFTRKLHERLNYIEPQVQSVARACEELQSSRSFRQVLEMVLALGNYMNRGNRGGAYGFKLKSLLSVVDTKSTSNRDFTLLHFMLGAIDGSPGGDQQLNESLAAVYDASKVGLVEVSKEISLIRRGFAELETELRWHFGQKEHLDGDTFPVSLCYAPGAVRCGVEPRANRCTSLCAWTVLVVPLPGHRRRVRQGAQTPVPGGRSQLQPDGRRVPKVRGAFRGRAPKGAGAVWFLRDRGAIPCHGPARSA